MSEARNEVAPLIGPSGINLHITGEGMIYSTGVVDNNIKSLEGHLWWCNG